MNILSSFTQPHVIPNVNDFIYSVMHKIIYFEPPPSGPMLFWLSLYANTAIFFCVPKKKESYTGL